MFQYKYDDHFNNIIKDITHWTSIEDIPKTIIDYINEISNKRIIYDELNHKYYCCKCCNELDEHYHCNICDLNHINVDKNIYSNKDISIVTSFKICYLKYITHYFIFNVIDGDTYLYNIEEYVDYNNPFYNTPFKTSTISINLDNSYYIDENGLTNLETLEFTSYKSIKEAGNNIEEESDEVFDIFERFELCNHKAYIYTNNFSDLKESIYKYTKIWELRDYIKDISMFTIANLTMYPLYYPQFEYLINYKLYNLTWNIPFLFKGNTFKEMFGIDKKHLPFMSKYNITSEQYRIFKIYPIEDIELLKFYERYSYNLINTFENTKVDLVLLKKYFEENNLEKQYLTEYIDYIEMVKELNIDLTNKKVLYPDNLRNAHDELYDQIEVVNNPEIDKKIKSISNILSINKYEDDKYIIYPPSSIEELIEESKQQKNCVRTYAEDYTNNTTQLYFMREKKDINKSLVTIEVWNNKIIQARVKYNELPNEDIKRILNKWESTLVAIKDYQQ